MSGAPSRAERMRERLAVERAAHHRRGWIYRALVVLTGVTVTLAGVAMLVLPGPAFIVIPVGLAMLALEFEWAERLLDKAIEQADVAQRKATHTTPAQRAFGAVAAVLAAAAAVAAALLWNIPILPV